MIDLRILNYKMIFKIFSRLIFFSIISIILYYFGLSFSFQFQIGIVIILLWFGYNYLSVKTAQDNAIKGEYDAIVLTNKRLDDKRAIYLSGVGLLIRYLKKKNKPFKIMKSFDDKQFRELIYDTNCRGLYIMGHGTRHYLRIDKKIIEYKEFRDAPKKEFVVQLHCNHDGGESLADLIALNKDKSYVSNGTRDIFDNLYFFLNSYLNN